MQDKSMKAIQQREFGGPEVLQYQDAHIPKVKEGEILVKVSAVGLNPPDWYLREGYKSLPAEWRPQVEFPLVLGTDVSGVVEEVAANVSSFKPGDEIYAMIRFPEGMAGQSRGYAEYVTIPAREAALKPRKVSHKEAAAAPMSLLTAWQFMVELGHSENNPLQDFPHQPLPIKGKTVLINGAAGGVGHFAVQIAKWQGANVIAVASGKHEGFLRELGADTFIDYSKSKVEEIVNDLDLVIDCVGGTETQRFLRTIKSGGALFPIYPLGFNGTEEAKLRDITVSATQVRSNGDQLQQLAHLLDDKIIRVAIDSSYPLESAAKAHERAMEGHIQGKIVLEV